jgi:hypothetical protein
MREITDGRKKNCARWLSALIRVSRISCTGNGWGVGLRRGRGRVKTRRKEGKGESTPSLFRRPCEKRGVCMHVHTSHPILEVLCTQIKSWQPTTLHLARPLGAAFQFPVLLWRGNKYIRALSASLIQYSTRTQCIFSCPSPPLCSGSNLISVSILMMAIHASTALFSCFTLLILGSNTPILTTSAVLPLSRSSP